MNKTKQHKSPVVCIVPSTHWDREWYLPFRRFQVRLIRLFDKVRQLLDSGLYPFFLMDGQWIMLEDYLEIKPDEQSWAEKRIRAGELEFGPWYVVPDTLIPSGESLARNLQIGQEMARRYGGGLTVGYSPDSFGLAAQLPQIYAQFGFEAAMFTRGQRIKSERTVEMRWQSPDGTVLPSLFGEYSYGLFLVVPTVWRNVERLVNTPEKAVSQAAALLAADNRRTCLHHRLWIVGVDHIEPKKELPGLIAALNETITDAKFELSTMQAYFGHFTKEMSTVSEPLSVGEQRGPYKEHFVLGNTLSARADIKKINRAAENKLAMVGGTLSALHSRGNTGYGRLDCRSIQKFAWKLLIQNHAHDSICACSSDETMNEVEHRMKSALQLAREVEKESLFHLGKTIVSGPSRGALLVYNPLPFSRSERIRERVIIPCDLEHHCLVDENGNPVPDALVRQIFRKRLDIEAIKTNEFTELAADTTRIPLGGEGETDICVGIEVDFIAEDIPACGYRCYYFGEKAASAIQHSSPLESDCLRVEIHADGTLDIIDKRSGRVMKNTHYFEVTSDEGDSYTFSPGGEPLLTKGGAADIIYTDDGAVIKWSLDTPYGLIDIRSELSLSVGGESVLFCTEIENCARDMRLRAVFDYPGTAAYSMGDTAFDLTERPVFSAAELAPANITTFPMRDVVALAMPWGKEAVFSDGIHEYEAVNHEDGVSLALTLMRAVSKIYATKTLTKNESESGCGVRWWSEKSQMQGKYRLRYAVRAYGNDPGQTAVLNDAAAFSLPLIPWGVYTEGDAPAAALGCAVKGAVMTSMESGDDNEVRLRLHNPQDVPAQVEVVFASHIDEACLLTLSGEITECLESDACTVSFILPPHRITTMQALLEEGEFI